MRVLVLCPGDWLRFWRVDAGNAPDALVGVNRAACFAACDAWACSDHPLHQNIQGQVIGSPLWFTRTRSAEQVQSKGIPWRGEVLSFDEIPIPYASIRWTHLTIFAAIGYAVHIGATEIEMYGASWKGELDFDGVNAGHTRNENRWKQERQMFETVQVELAGRGISLTRMIHD